MAIGFNCHQVVGVSAISLADSLSLAFQKGFNIVWLGAFASNTNTIYVGFNSDVAVPVNGVRNEEDGWPLTAGKTLPILVGELFNAGASLYVIAGAANQDLAVIAY